MTIAETLRNEGMQQGIQAGMQQGMQRGVHAVAQNMLHDGLPEVMIAKYTGLELSEVVALRKKMNH